MHGKNSLRPLTSLRFFAAAAIVLFHAQSVFGIAWINPDFPLWQGVSFFFVLSGFILAYNYPALNSRKDALMFYAARFARVWPAHIAVLLLVAGFAYSRGDLVQPHVGWYAVADSLLIQAWIPFKEVYFSINIVAWTLSVELFFYMLFPLLIWNWKRTWHISLIGGIFLIVLFVSMSNYFMLPIDANQPWQLSQQALIVVNPLTRTFEFMLGIAACSTYRAIYPVSVEWPRMRTTALEIITVAMVVVAMMLTPSVNATHDISIWIGEAGENYLRQSGTAIVFGVAILVFAIGRGWISRLLAHPLLVRLGEISFSLYLVHTLVLSNFGMHDQLISAHPSLSFWTYWSICLALSYAIYTSVEQPCRMLLLPMAKRRLIPGSSPSRRSLLSLARVSAPGIVIVLGIAAIGLFLKPFDLISIPSLHAFPQGVVVQANFDERLSLEEIRMCSVDANTVELSYALKSLVRIPLKDVKLAVHLMNASGQITTGLDHLVDKGAPTLDENTFWMRQIRFPATQLKDVDQLGFAMFTDVKYLYSVSGAKKVDWGGKRLLLPVPNDWKNICTSVPGKF